MLRDLSADPARVGSTVTVMLRAGRESELLSSPEGCSVNGRQGIPITAGGGGYYQVVYIVGEGDESRDGTLPFFCDFTDEFR